MLVRICAWAIRNGRLFATLPADLRRTTIEGKGINVTDRPQTPTAYESALLSVSRR